MKLCHGWGIPHSEFLSWPETDQDKALAYAEFVAATCPECGTRPAEWDPAAGGDRHAYTARTVTCPGCQVRGDLERELTDSGVEVSGRYVVLMPRADADRADADLAARRAARAGR